MHELVFSCHRAENYFEFEILQLVRRKDDPAQDLRDDLAELLALWREETGYATDLGYHPAAESA